MALLTVESNAPEIEILDTVLTEPEKDKAGNVVVYKKGKLEGRQKGNPITSGLNEFQIEKLKDCVYNIRNVDGAYKLYIAKQLYELRGIIRGSKKGENPKQWTAFKKSRLVPFSSRDIQDLCASYEWMRDSGIDASQLNTVGLRTLAVIASTTNKPAQARLTSRLIGGEQITREIAVKEIEGPKKEKKDLGWDAYYATIVPKVEKMDTKKLREKVISLEKENYNLKEKQKELKNSMKINPS